MPISPLLELSILRSRRVRMPCHAGFCAHYGSQENWLWCEIGNDSASEAPLMLDAYIYIYEGAFHGNRAMLHASATQTPLIWQGTEAPPVLPTGSKLESCRCPARLTPLSVRTDIWPRQSCQSLLTRLVLLYVRSGSHRATSPIAVLPNQVHRYNDLCQKRCRFHLQVCTSRSIEQRPPTRSPAAPCNRTSMHATATVASPHECLL
jgi:hypothetical protein